MINAKKILISLCAGVLAVSLLVAPLKAEAIGRAFGGKIVYSTYRGCNIYLGVADIYIPVQEIGVQRGGDYETYIYIYYTFILQLFGITDSIYSYGQFFREGPNILGQYIPVPGIPWEDCTDLSPNNVIIKMGTSLF